MRRRVDALPPGRAGGLISGLGDGERHGKGLRPRRPLDPMEGRKDYSRHVVSAAEILENVGGALDWEWAAKPKAVRRWSAGVGGRDGVRPERGPLAPLREGEEGLGGGPGRRFPRERLDRLDALAPIDPNRGRALRSAPSGPKALGRDALSGRMPAIPVPPRGRVPDGRSSARLQMLGAEEEEKVWGEGGPRYRAADGRSRRMQAPRDGLGLGGGVGQGKRHGDGVLGDRLDALRADKEREQEQARRARREARQHMPTSAISSPLRSRAEAVCTVVDDLEGLPAEIAAARLERKARQKQILGFQMITDGLFLGPAAVSSRKGPLLEAGITHILNATDTEPLHFPEEFTYTRISVQDTVSEDIGVHFDHAYCFIRDARAGGGRVYVHCVAGVSRSVSFVMCFLMRAEKMTLWQAFKHVKAARACAQPNEGFWRLLEQEEIRLRGTCSCTLHQYKTRILCEAFPSLTPVEVEAELVKAGGDTSIAAMQLSQMA